MKRNNTLLGTLIALGLTARLWALPQDPTPVHGQVQIQNGANFVQILQQTPQAIINWGQFNIGQGETVRFLQPSQQAAILNRVTGLDPSLIQGALQANGRVFLLNPNGILFGPNSVVDVGSFTASTLKMSDEDFLNGTYKLTQDSSLPLAALTNQGTIKVAEGGYVVLVSPLLDNQGMILAQAGQVQLGASTQATFSVDGRGLVQFALPDGFDPQFQGGGKGGTVLLQPAQMSQLLRQVVTNPSLVEAGSFQTLANGQVLAHGAEGILLNSGTVSTDGGAANGGSIRLDSSQATIHSRGGLLSANSQSGDGGEIRVLSAGQTVSSGTVQAAAEATGRGGFVEVSGKNLWLQGTVNVASAQGVGGSILLDPTDITIVDGAGGSFDGNLPNPNNAGAGSVSVSAMQGFAAVTLNASHDVTYNGAGFTLPGTSLSVIAGNDILFTTAGSIQATSLSLQASRDVIIAGTGSLGLSTSSGDLTILGGRDVGISANGVLTFSSPTRTSVTATSGRLDLSSSSMVINGPRTGWTAGGNLSVLSISVAPTLGAGNLSLNANNISLTTPGANGLSVRAGNLTVNATQDFVANTTGGNFDVRTSVSGINITAGQSLAVNGTSGFVNFQADNAGKLMLTAPSLDLQGAQVLLSAADDVNLNATGTDVLLRSNNNQVQLTSNNGAIIVTAARDVLLQAAGTLGFQSSTGTTLNATRDLNLASINTVFNGPRTTWTAGRNLSDTAVSTGPTLGVGNLSLNANNISLTTPGANGYSLRAGNLTVNATQDFVANTTGGNFDVRTSVGGINITAGQSLAVNGTSGFVNFQADNAGKLTLTAPSLDLQGAQVLLSAADDVNLNATGTDVLLRSNNNQVQLTSNNGAIIVTAARDVLLQAAGTLGFQSSTGTTLNATRDLNLASINTVFNGPRTTWTAGRNLSDSAVTTGPTLGVGNLSLNANNISLTTPGANGYSLRAGNLTVNATQDFVANTTGGNFDVRTSVSGINITAGQSLAVNGTSGFVNFQADNAGKVRLTAPSLDLQGAQVLLSAADDVNLNATGTDVLLRSTNNQIQLTSNNGAVIVNAARDVLLQAAGTLGTQSSTGTTLTATRDLNLVGVSTVTNGPQTTWTAGRNLSDSAVSVGPTLGLGNLTLNGGNVSLNPIGINGYSLRSGSLTVNATQDFTANANGNFDLATTSSGVNVTAGGNFLITATGSKSITANSDRLNISGGNVALSGVSLIANGNAALGLNSAGNLSVGSLSTSPGANATLSGANIVIDSMQNISGGNYTINTPGNLTEVTAASNPPTLTGLNISAGRVFNTGSGNGKFSIPNVSTPGALAALVTAGNDSAFNSSASFQTFNSAVLNPGHIDHQTGDIYVNGVLVYGGLPPVVPPDPPPPPPTPPNPTVTPAAAQQQQSQITPEQRSQILAQSNLALGNLGSFSRELSESERAQLSTRMDSLHQTWPLDPFSPTLALAVPGGRPPVYASELAQLQALLLMSTPGDDPLDKDRAAYNVIVDQELREIWEVRYWRHLLEGFIIWVDRE